MPIKKVGKKWLVKDKEYDSEDEAIKAYQAYLNTAMGIKPEAKPKAKKKPMAAHKDDDEDLLNFGHD